MSACDVSASKQTQALTANEMGMLPTAACLGRFEQRN